MKTWLRRRAAPISLVLLALALASQYRTFLAMAAVSGLDSRDPATRDATIERLRGLGDAGQSLLEDWLDQAEGDTHRAVYARAVGDMFSKPGRAAWGDPRAARFLVANAPKDLALRSCTRECLVACYLPQLGAAGVEAVSERLERALERDEAIDSLLLVTLLEPLVEMYPAGAERARPVLEELWRRWPDLSLSDRSSQYWFGDPLDRSIVRTAIVKSVLRYRGLAVEELEQREMDIASHLVRIARGQRWLTSPGGGARPAFVDLAELRRSLRRVHLFRPCYSRSFSEVGGEEPEGTTYDCAPASAAPNKKWWAIARPVDPERSGPLWYVMNHELRVAVYHKEPAIDRLNATLPPGAVEIKDWTEREVIEGGWFFDCPEEADDEAYDEASGRCPGRATLSLSSGAPLELSHGELKALALLKDIAAARLDADEGEAIEGLVASLDLLFPERGWHAGHAFETGENAEGWWARARPLKPGESGRYLISVDQDLRLRFRPVEPAALAPAGSLALTEGGLRQWRESRQRKDFLDFGLDEG